MVDALLRKPIIGLIPQPSEGSLLNDTFPLIENLVITVRAIDGTATRHRCCVSI